MATPNTKTNVVSWQYTKPAIFLHWLLAALIVFMAGLGWYMMTIEHTPAGDSALALHKSIGLLVFVLVLLRVLWRLFHKPLELPASVPRWQVWLSNATQGLLYAMMLLIPITGIIGSEYSKAGLAFFGIPLPAGVTPDRATAHQMFEIHEAFVWVTVALLALHVVGGLKHLLIDHDEVFGRMWPRHRT